MAIQVHPTESGKTLITFTLPEDVPDGPVSVVGSFNDWNPDAHPLLTDEGGIRAATVSVEETEELHFRYLGSDGAWFDDPDADEITPQGGVIDLARRGSIAAEQARRQEGKQQPAGSRGQDTATVKPGKRKG
jgi:hypothetical protein